MQIKAKLYMYDTWIFCLILWIFGIVASIVAMCFLWRNIYYLIACFVIAVILVVSLIYLIIIGMFTPIKISDNEIEYKKIRIEWKDIKITAYPKLHSSFQYGYYLIFDTQYLYSLKDIRKKLFKGCRVYMKKRSLLTILNYCQTKILILNPKADKEVLPKSNSVCNQLLTEFNKKFGT